MDKLNQLEIQNIRHIHGFGCNICDKIEYYKSLSLDEKIIKIFDKSCNTITNLKEDLANML